MIKDPRKQRFHRCDFQFYNRTRIEQISTGTNSNATSARSSASYGNSVLKKRSSDIR